MRWPSWRRLECSGIPNMLGFDINKVVKAATGYNSTQLVSQLSQPWPPPASMAPQCPTWGLALHADMSNEWVTTPWASRYNFGGGWGCVWPSKHSFVLAMMHHHNIRVFWGSYTPSTPPKIMPTCLGSCCPSICWHIKVEGKASCGVLGGHFCQQHPWSAMVVLVIVGCWRLTLDQPTVGILTVIYRSIF